MGADGGGEQEGEGEGKGEREEFGGGGEEWEGGVCVTVFEWGCRGGVWDPGVCGVKCRVNGYAERGSFGCGGLEIYRIKALIPVIECTSDDVCFGK